MEKGKDGEKVPVICFSLSLDHGEDGCRVIAGFWLVPSIEQGSILYSRAAVLASVLPSQL
jgi:hypothetical protein